ncbi:CCC motif membrane protein [Tenacibaculum piscium]|uniref:CCC motif membrane protein n=1 Tax=Tenacibaculum piscium TaxID=1458515 RepID=UPI001F293655|nr:CCC motif membrane protein [Tenacibaculum piscium]
MEKEIEKSIEKGIEKEMKENLPNSTTSLVLGIFSILTCFCYGIIGLPLGILAIILGNKAVQLDNDNPEKYNGVKNASTARILGLIGMILNIIFIGYVIWFLNQIGWDTLGDAELMMERINELKNE